MWRQSFKEFARRALQGKRKDVFRILSIYFSYPLYKIGVKPSLITFVYILLSVLFGIILMTSKSYVSVRFIISIVYYALIAPILDSSNGNLARAYGISSDIGYITDILADYIAKLVFIVSYTLFLYQITMDEIILLLLLLNMLCMMIYYIIEKNILIVQFVRVCRAHNEGDQVSQNFIPYMCNKILAPYLVSDKKMELKDYVAYLFTQTTGQAILFVLNLVFYNITHIAYLFLIAYIIVYFVGTINALLSLPKRDLEVDINEHTEHRKS